MRLWGWGPCGGIRALLRRDTRESACSLSLLHVTAQGEGGCLQTKKKGLTRTHAAGS